MFFIIGLNACKKDDSTQFKNLKNLSNSAKVLNWINTQQASAKTEQNKSKYESLKNNIDVNELWVEDIREGDKVILLPIKDGFEIKNNKNKPVTNYLFLIMDAKGEIHLGEILQYLSEDKIKKTALPINDIHKVYTFEPVSGQFTNLSILNTEHYLTETEYRNDKLFRTSVVRPKAKDSNATLPPAPGDVICVTTDWYEWQLITYENGTTEYTETFLYSSTVCSNTGGGGGGGNGSGGGGGISTDEDDEVPFSRTANVVWRVGNGIVGTEYWQVNSEEKLMGLKPKALLLKATFTSASHVSTSLQASQNVGTWNQGSHSVNIMDEFTVTATNSGTVTFNGPHPARPLNNLQSWTSYLLWPR